MRFRTNYATKPDPSEGAAVSEPEDPMDMMVALPKGGFNLAAFVSKDPGADPEVDEKELEIRLTRLDRDQANGNESIR